MSKIDELIQELCPDGVEVRELGDVVTFYRGKALSKSDKGTGDTPIILYGELYTTYGDYITEIVSLCANEKAKKGTEIKYGDIIMPITSTTKEAQIGKASALKVHGSVYLGGDAIALRHEQEPGYLVHLLNSAWFEYLKMQHRTGTTVSHLSPKGIAKIKIPIPPLEVQKEIVSILDKFTQLEAELSAELEARRKQYEYYRNQLFVFDESREVKWLKLSDIARVTIGEFVHKNKQNPNGLYPVYNGGRSETGYFDEYNNTGEKIVISARGAYAGFVNRVMKPYWAGNSSYSIDVTDKNKVNWHYVYYYLKSSESKFTEQQQKGGIPALSKKQVEVFKIPIPPLDEQDRIVSILDKFDNLTNSISEGLPAEINARRRQYEYYRTKLLTFQELSA